MTVTVTGQINAGDYSASIVLKDSTHYEWADGTIAAKTVNWTIAKKTLAASDVTVTGTLSIDAANLTRDITISIPTGETGIITISPMSVPGLTITPQTQNGNQIVVHFVGDGSTAASQKFTVDVTEGKNYTAGTFADKFTFTATYWEWGSETATADAAWWAGLKAAVASMSTTELSACVGKTKSVTLTSAVLGTTTHLVRCVGYNVHRDKNNPTRNTLTFETANTLATATVFGTSTTLGYWRSKGDSTVRTQCLAYGNAFPGKASVSTVSIGTATAINNSQNGSVTYTDETFFLLSDAEHGFPSGHDYNSGKGYAASYNEFDKENTSKTPCQYCTSNANRIKKQGDSGSAYYYWERSLYYGNENGACFVRNEGKPNGSYYNSSYGLAPAFVI